jgi:hypothetical protein
MESSVKPVPEMGQVFLFSIKSNKTHQSQNYVSGKIDKKSGTTNNSSTRSINESNLAISPM